jgi:hypothetical protein
MNLEILGQAGPQVLSDGTNGTFRQEKSGGLVVTELHGKFYEAASRGRLFFQSNPLAGVAAGSSATADVLGATSPWAILNPVNSGVNLSIVAIYMSFIRVPTLAGTHWITSAGGLAASALVSGTLTPSVCALIGGSQASAAKPYFGAVPPTLTGTTLASIPLWTQGTGAVTVADVLNPPPYFPDGSLVLAPGSLIGGQGVPQAAAALTNVVAWSVFWEEIPV